MVQNKLSFEIGILFPQEQDANITFTSKLQAICVIEKGVLNADNIC